MAITYGFFNSQDGDRKYTAADIGDYLQGIVSSGVFADSSTSLQVQAGGGMNVEVQPGRALLNYKYLKNDAPYTLTLAPGVAQDRVDAIVARMDLNARLCEIAVKEGTPGAAPVAPSMSRTDVLMEYMLASVYVKKLASQITQANITDTRANTNVCGWVHGIIDQVDTSTLFAQWQAAYEEAYAELGDYLAEQQAAWEAFFANVTEDNVLPAPALADAGKALFVNTAGNGYTLARIMPENLLDNSDFSNPVNQRGGDLFTAVAQYTIDRWQIDDSTDLIIEKEEKYISISCPDATGTKRFYQRIPYEKAPKPGTKVTVAFKDHTDGLLFYTATAPAQGEYTDLRATSVEKVGVRLSYESGNYAYVAFRVPVGKTFSPEWVALYEGEYTAENLPEYRPKGYAAELAECMRYFIKTRNGFGFINASNTIAYISVPLPVIMRTKPSVASYNMLSIRGVGKIVDTSAITNVTISGGGPNDGPMAQLSITGSFSDMKQNAVYYEGEICLSADL